MAQAIKSAVNGATTPATTIAATFGSAVASGNKIVVFGTASGNQTAFTITDSQSNTYTKGMLYDATNDQAIFWGYATASSATAATVTIGGMSSTPYRGIIVAEYANAGALLAGPMTNNTSNTTATDNVTSAASGTLASSPSIVVGFVMDDANASQTITAGTGYSIVQNTFGGIMFAAEDRAYSGTTSTAPTFTFGTAGRYIAAALVFANTSATNATPTPAAVAATAAVPSATVIASGNATATPAAVAGTAAVGSPSVLTPSNTNVSVAAVAAVASVMAMTGATSSSVDPSAVAAVAAVGAPTISTGTNATATPAAVAAVAAVGSPVVTAPRNATPAPASVAAVASVAGHSVQSASNATATPATVAAAAAVGSVTVTVVSAGTATPSTVPAVAAVGSPSIVANRAATVTPAAVGAVAAVGAPTVTASSIFDALPGPGPGLTLTTADRSRITLTPAVARIEIAVSIHVGDTSPALTGRLTSNGAPKDITGAALEVHIARPDGTLITRAASITAAATGDWSMAWQVGDLTQAGQYRVEVQVTYAAGGIQTFGHEWFTVDPQLA